MHLWIPIQARRRAFSWAKKPHCACQDSFTGPIPLRGCVAPTALARKRRLLWLRILMSRRVRRSFAGPHVVFDGILRVEEEDLHGLDLPGRDSAEDAAGVSGFSG